MQIVIDIPEGTYDLIKHNVQAQSAYQSAYYAIRRGTVLPKGHGRLIDADAFIKTECSQCDGFCDVCNCDCLNCKSEYRCEFIKEVDSADVILKADKENDE